MKDYLKPNQPIRKIIHADMDAFYASIEMRENPKYMNKPLVVGGSPYSRSVVCSANYEARKYGIHSAMPCSKAKKLCPEAIFVPPNFLLYKQVSQEIHKIFLQYTDKVESISLDEAYLDVTDNKLGIHSATSIAKKIQKEVHEKTSLTVSCGVSYNKFLAKVASDWKKPNGLFVIRPEDSEEFLNHLPIEKFHGIGKVTSEKMKKMGILTGYDLKKKTLFELESMFGKIGAFYYEIVRGIDNRPVVTERETKSVGIEDTFPKDTDNEKELLEHLEYLVNGLEHRLELKNVRGRCLTVKIKYYDFTVHTIQETFSHYIVDKYFILAAAKNLFYKLWNGNKIRLLGLSVSKFYPTQNLQNQLLLFS